MIWRKGKPDWESRERAERADKAVAKSEQDVDQTEELKSFIGEAMAYLARLNQENNFSAKMAKAYGGHK